MQEIEEQKRYLDTFIEKLPKVEAHYCRKDSDKNYIQQTFKSKSELYVVYKEECIKAGKNPLSNCKFFRIFEEKKLSLYTPKKDQCDTCCQYAVKQLSEEKCQTHISKKDKARTEKCKDKKDVINNLNYTFVIDAQAVKLCPVLNAGKLYFKTRLQVNIFTLYNLATHQCTNYVWNETEGDLKSSSFVLCIIRHLTDHCLENKKPIIIYSDGCCYQNRNVVLSNALSYFSTQHNITIEQKYLEKGHTQMECDATHALIERKLRGRDITLPSQYVTIIKEARKKPFILDGLYLTHDFFF